MSQQWTPPPAGGNVPNYLVPSILGILCCGPFGILATVFAAQVNGKVQSGDIAGAMDASRKAKMFAFIAIGLGLIFWIIWGVMMILGIGLGALNA